MRVHPTSVSSSWSKWQFPIGAGVLAILLLAVIFRGPSRQVAAAPVPVEKRIQVAIAHSKIETGQPLEKADIRLEERPISTLPADVITSLDALKNKVAAGPIPAGYPLAVALLASPIVVVPQDSISDSPEDPVETLLKEIEPETVAVPVDFNTIPPGRGRRIAVAFLQQGKSPIMLAEEAWIVGVTGREATVRVEPSRALILQVAKGAGKFSFIELPMDGASPFVGQAVKSLEDFQALVSGDAKDARRAAANEKPAKGARSKGYAWVTGEGRRYALDENGEISIVEGE